MDIDTPRWALPLLKPSRYKAAWGGRGSGKSHFFGEYIIEQHATNPTESTVCIREVQKSLDQSVKRLLESKIEKLNAGYYFEVQDAKIISKGGGGLITFQGMQNHTADSIKSLEGYKRAWVEEGQTLTQYSLDLLRPTIRMPDSEILFSWNPRFKTDPVDMFFRKNKHPDATVVMVNWNDNPWFPEELRKEMEHDFKTDPEKADHIWNGAYGSVQGAILARWVAQAERTNRTNSTEGWDSGGAPLEISCDLGFRDTAAFWFWQPQVGGFKVFDYMEGNGLEAAEWIGFLADRIGNKKLGTIWLPHDARAKTFQSKYSVIEQFVTYFGADHVKIVPQTKKTDQINAARTVLPRCTFHVNCDKGLDALRAWSFDFDETKNSFSKDPKHDWASHASDAFSYGCQMMQVRITDSKDSSGRGLTVGDNKVTLEELWKQAPRRKERI